MEVLCTIKTAILRNSFKNLLALDRFVTIGLIENHLIIQTVNKEKKYLFELQAPLESFEGSEVFFDFELTILKTLERSSSEVIQFSIIKGIPVLNVTSDNSSQKYRIISFKNPTKTISSPTTSKVSFTDDKNIFSQSLNQFRQYKWIFFSFEKNRFNIVLNNLSFNSATIEFTELSQFKEYFAVEDLRMQYSFQPIISFISHGRAPITWKINFDEDLFLESKDQILYKKLILLRH